MKRRQFISQTAAVAGAAVLPTALSGQVKKNVPPPRLKIACIGTGTQGTRVMLQLLKIPDLLITAVADPVKEDTRYQNWGPYELRSTIRYAIGEPNWDEGVEGCRAGREPARQIVNTWYGKQKDLKYKGCNAYADFRELLEKEKDLDGVVIGAPDHQHAYIAMKAMEKGLHVFCQKPMTNSVYEARLLAETAAKTKVATQVATMNASAESTDKLCEMIWSGAIGPVREVHNWSNRPVWESGFTQLPAEEPVPEGFDWDLWLGRAEWRPFSYKYTHTVFRAWYDFGTGALGDMGCYSFDPVFRALKLTAPETVEAYANTAFGVTNLVPHPVKYVSHPLAMTAHFRFPARAGMPPVDLYWYDGGIKPPKPAELDEDELGMPNEGLLFVGDYGKILAEFHGGNPRLIPSARNKEFSPPPPVIERSRGHYEDWIDACRGGKPPRARFEVAGPVTETLCLGIIAMRIGKKLRWDPVKMTTGVPEADALIKPYYRSGWEI